MGKITSTHKTVLFLDDEDSERASAVEILQSQGFTVLEADSYKTAVEVFEANRGSIDIFVADISLPDGNGCELAVSLRNQNPDLRVLFVSGHVGAEVCRFYGLDVTDLHFLRKPFDGEELVRCIRRVLRAENPFPEFYAPKVKTASGTPEQE
jgi:DNA-binding response OmpR family regulator